MAMPCDVGWPEGEDQRQQMSEQERAEYEVWLDALAEREDWDHRDDGVELVGEDGYYTRRAEVEGVSTRGWC